MDDDGARLAAMETRARVGDREAFERHLEWFHKKYLNRIPDVNRRADQVVPVEIESRLILGDVAGAKAALENFSPPAWSGPEPGAIYARAARAFAAAGKLDDLRPWVEVSRAPEFAPDTYANACVGVAEGLWLREREAKK
jgi:hypothetical protein